jgi:hypothetical protein
MTVETFIGIIIVVGILAGCAIWVFTDYIPDTTDYVISLFVGMAGLILIVYGFSNKAMLEDAEKELHRTSQQIEKLKKECYNLNYTEQQCDDAFLEPLKFKREMLAKRMKELIIQKYER